MIGITNALKKSSVGIVETINVTLNTNQQNHSDLIGVEFTLTYGDIEDTFKWKGEAITIEVPAFVNYSLSFNDVTGYLKPEDVSYEAQANNSRSVTFTYKAESVQVSVGADNGSSVEGAEVTIDDARYIWDGTLIEHKVPFGKSYTISVNDISGYSTPESKSFKAEQAVREVSFTYIASALKVNILSNQSTESSWDPTITNVKATVSYNGASVEVSNGEQINLPSGVDVTISFPEFEGYKKPEDIVFTHNGGLVEKSGTYQCELLTVNVSADQGSVSGFEVTISKQEDVGVNTKYTRLEYIESSGSQYINTGVVPTENTRVVMDIEPSGITSTSNYAIFGERNSNQSSGLFSLWLLGGKFRTDFGTTSGNLFIEAPINGRYIIDKNKNTTTIGGVSATNPAATISTTYPIYLFSNNYNNEADTRMFPAKVYSCQIYENGNLVRDYIPALRADGIAGLYDAVNDTFYPSNGTSNFNYTSNGPIVAKQTSATGIYKIPFDTSYTVSASSVSGYTTPKSVTRIANSKSYVIEQKYEVIKVKDLSLFDVYDNPINRSTANCYVVREAGQYKFPLVYGNAIKNGKVNTAAYTNNGTENSHDFVDATGTVISSPYIDKEGITPYVIISNQDSNTNLIQINDCKKEDGVWYAEFNIQEVPATGANFILSLYFPDIVWHWHIWLWSHDLSPVGIGSSYHGLYEEKYKIMPVNLASMYDDDMVHIKNWFYQWGRPTPMLLPSAWNSTTDHPNGSINIIQNSASTLQDGLANPTNYYSSSTPPYNWFGNKNYYNLWDAASTYSGSSDNDTVKTVYDPCPVGWKVPNGNVFGNLSGIISETNGIIKVKRYFYDTVGVDFPLSGCRYCGYGYHGAIMNIGSKGFVWTSAYYNDNDYYDNIYNWSFSSSEIKKSFYESDPDIGNSIRPVEDDNINLDVIMISFTIDETNAGGSVKTYQAESGMTWFEWVNSEYNTYGFKYDENAELCREVNGVKYLVIDGSLDVDTYMNEHIYAGIPYMMYKP